jgi:hypothetical protein
MTPAEMDARGVWLFGRWGWQTRLAERLKVDGSTVRRWLSGKVPIPGLASVAIELLVTVEEYRRKSKFKFEEGTSFGPARRLTSVNDDGLEDP